MKNTEQVKNALDLLRQADAGTEAPAFVETRLRAAFREKHVVAPAPVATVPWWSAWRMWAGVAMAGLVVGALVYRAAMPGSVEAPTPKTAPVAAVSKPAPVVEQAVAPPAPAVAVAKAAPKASRPARVKRAEPVQTYSASAREGDEFLAIPYAPPMTAQDRGEVVRVRLPRQSLRQFGIPVNPERLFERVPADVLVGEDGIPRGIRFVRTTESR